jgi:hypothetical protein
MGKTYTKLNGARAELADPPKPGTARRNTWYFANTENICKQVYDMGQAYYNRMQDPKGRAGHHIRNPVHLTKLWYWLYLTGARQQEAFRKPYPELEIINRDGGTYVIVKHVNEKHWINRKEQIRQITTATIPIFCEWEKKAWEYLTDGGLTTRAEDIFRYDLWTSTKNNKILRLFKTNFKTNLKDQNGKLHKNSGVAPNILRSMRAYNVLDPKEHKAPVELAKVWFGWSREDMCYYYPHIRTLLQQQDQLDTLKAKNLLTNLKINSGALLLQPNPNYQ